MREKERKKGRKKALVALQGLTWYFVAL